MNVYEGMFVIDTRETRSGNEEGEEKVQSLIAKSGGEVAGMKLWDERKLAYEIKGRSAGTYFLTYFQGDPEIVKRLSRECQLSTAVLRAFFLRVKEVPDLDAVKSPSEIIQDEKNEEEARRDAEAAPAEAVKPAEGVKSEETEAAEASTEAPAVEESAAPAEVEAATDVEPAADAEAVAPAEGEEEKPEDAG